MALAPETLEEFLSILRPSVMPFHTLNKYPTSPVRRQQHRSRSSLSVRPPPAPSYISGALSSPDQQQQQFQEKTTEELEDQQELMPPNESMNNLSAWRGSGPLYSPVSRNHTMNPFARRPSHENIALHLAQGSYPPASPVSNIVFHSPLSPAMVPLPPSTSPP